MTRRALGRRGMDRSHRRALGGACELLEERRLLSAGSPDSAFGTSGQAVVQSGAGDAANAITVEPDGKILVAGSTEGLFSVTRLNSDGTIDATFGGGTVTVTKYDNPPSTGFAEGGVARGLALTAQGDVIAVGQQTYNQIMAPSRAALGKPDFAAVDIMPNGMVRWAKLIPFDSPTSPITSAADAVVVQPNGFIDVAGYAGPGDPQQDDFALARLDAGGNLDLGFGQNGKVVTDFSRQGDHAKAIALDALEDIIVAGYAGTADGGSDMAVAKYTTSGTLDPTFSKRMYDFFGLDDFGTGVAIQADGKIIVSGTADRNLSILDREFAAVRISGLDGAPDPTYGTNGKTAIDLGGSSDDEAEAMALQADGKAVLVGETKSSGSFQLGVLRLTSDGQRDAAFGADGQEVGLLGPGDDAINAVALDGDGRILVVGTANATPGNPVALVERFEPGEYPYGGAPVALPGVVAAANYDNGSEGAGYLDTTPGNDAGGAFRSDYRPGSDVDLENDSPGDPAHVHVAFIRAGEYLNYTVSAPQGDSYIVKLSVASAGAGGTYHFQVDGGPPVAFGTIPDTGGFLTFQQTSAQLVRIDAGVHVFSVRFDSNGPSGFVGNLQSLSIGVITGVHFTADGDGVDWTDPLNWSTGKVPGPSDDVTVSVADNRTVFVNAGSQSVKSLVATDPIDETGGTLSVLGALTVGGGETTLNGNSPIRIGQLIESAGTLDGTAEIDLTEPGSQWSGGTMAGSGATVVEPQAVLTVTGAVNHLSTRPFNNNGMVAITGGGLELDGNGTHAGAFMLAASTVLDSGGSGAQQFGSSSSIAGGGTVEFTASSNSTVSGTYQVGATDVTGTAQATLQTTGSTGSLFVSGGTLIVGSPTTAMATGRGGRAAPPIDVISVLTQTEIKDGPLVLVEPKGVLAVDGNGLTFDGSGIARINLFSSDMFPGGVLRLGADVVCSATSTVTIASSGAGANSGAVDLAGAERTFNTAGNISLSVPLIDGALAKAGTGDLGLASSQSSYAGGTRLIAGTLTAVNTSNPLGTGGVTFEMGSLVFLTLTGGIDLPNPLTAAKGGTISLDVINVPGDPIRIGSITLGSALSVSGDRGVIVTGPAVLQDDLVLHNTGPVTFAGGISGPHGITKAPDSSGQVIFGGATPNTYTGATTVDGGTLTLASAALAVPGNLTVNGPATVRLFANDQIAPTAVVSFNPAKGIAGFDLNGHHQVLAKLSDDHGLFGTVHVGVGGSLLIHYAGGADPAAMLVDQLRQGNDAGKWDGGHIDIGDGYSGSAFALGYKDDGSTLQIKYVLAGDANLDGAVTFADLLSLAQRYQRPAATWAGGDFNYDGMTNFADLLILTQNYGKRVRARPTALRVNWG